MFQDILIKRGFISWREGGLLLGVIRSLSLLLAAAQIFIFHKGELFIASEYLIIGVVAVYTIARLFYPFHSYGRRYLSYLLIISDVMICCTLPFVTGGFNSPFILYPLTAVLSASLFFPQKTAYIVSVFVAISVISSEIFSHLFLNIGILIPVQLYVFLMGMYIIVGFLVAWLPYVGNINFYDTIKKRAVLEERSRLSRELHDGPAQRLATLILKLDLVEDSLSGSDNLDALCLIKEIKSELKDTHLEVRETIDQLRAKITKNPGLLSSLAQYTREFSHESGILCHVYLSDGNIEVSQFATAELLRVAQEALTNVKRHSQASHVEVRFKTKANQISMIIKDNGRGFNKVSAGGHYGLAVMQERIRNLDGKCEIISSPGSGTEIRVNVPAVMNAPR